MDKTLRLTDAELASLHTLLAREWMNTRQELHHTVNLEFRAEVKENLTEIATLMRKVEMARGIAVQA